MFHGFMQQWHVLLYDHQQKSIQSHPIEDLFPLQVGAVSTVSGQTLQQALTQSMAPEPVVLQVENQQSALERCFFAFQHSQLVETKQLGNQRFLLSFAYRTGTEDEILETLRYLGPHATLMKPAHLRVQLLQLVEQALEHDQ